MTAPFGCALPVLLVLSHCAIAQTVQTVPIQTVEIKGANSLDTRRNDTAGTITVGRDELTRYGDSSVSAVLKRQPGVSVVAGEIRMRGLGSGYTQILVNGEPVARGFSIDSIPPSLIDRIDIMRTATAEFGAQAIAGTINVILKKAGGAARTDLTLGMRKYYDRFNPSGALRWTDKRGNLGWSLGVDLARLAVGNEGSAHDVIVARGDPVATVRDSYELNVGTIDQLVLTPRLNWTFERGDTLALNTILERTRRRFDQFSTETLISGQPSSFPDNGFVAHNNTHNERGDVTWTRQLGANGKLLVKAALNLNNRDTDYVFRGIGSGGSLVRQVLSTAVDNSSTLSGKYLAPLGANHSLGIGWDGSRTERQEERLQRDSTFAGAWLGDLDEDNTAVVHRMALFAQDEWSITPRLQLYAGLRWERLRTATFGTRFKEVNSDASVASPIAQLLWKLPDSEKDQLRLALSRTYKAPPVANLVPRRYTVNNGNSPGNPDFRGNPALRPELAWGVEAAYERYFGKAGMASLSAYARRIDDVTVQGLEREDGAWITTPFNNGRATVWGIEMDGKRALGPRVDLRANVARNWSRMDAVPGPDNRLDSQVKASANAGIDYRPTAGHTVGMNLNMQFGGHVRSSAYLRSYTGPTRALEAYSLWKLDPTLQLRLSATNLLHRDQRTARVYDDGATFVGRDYAEHNRTSVRLTLEKRL